MSLPPLTVGDPAPWFIVSSTSSPAFHFDTVGGFRMVLSFFGSSRLGGGDRLVREFLDLQDQFEAQEIPFFGVTIDPNDVDLQNLIEKPGFFKLFWDFDRRVSALYGVYQSPEASDVDHYTPITYVLNERLQVVGVFPINDYETHVQQVFRFVSSLPKYPPASMAARQAPVLLIPHVLGRDLCQHLIQMYEADGGQESGFMRQIDGKTVEVMDYGFKQRRDVLLQDPDVLQAVNDGVVQRIKPEIEKAFQFSITRFERHLVACYEATTQGFFRRHRDNTTKGTAHRRFAMTLNLNTGEYEGGCLWFPEFGPQLYRPEVGEAVIFSCSLLHEATPVTAGRRFALLSFFYGEEDAQIRERNRQYVVLNDRKAKSRPEQLPAKSEGDRPHSQTNQSASGFQPQAGRAKSGEPGAQ